MVGREGVINHGWTRINTDGKRNVEWVHRWVNAWERIKNAKLKMGMGWRRLIENLNQRVGNIAAKT